MRDTLFIAVERSGEAHLARVEVSVRPAKTRAEFAVRDQQEQFVLCQNSRTDIRQGDVLLFPSGARWLVVLVERFSRTLHIRVRCEGEATSVNGHTLYAHWSTMPPHSTQVLLDEEDWHLICYRVEFPPRVREEPYNLQVGDEVICETLRVRAGVRHFVPVMDGGVVSVIGICVLLPDN